MKIYLETKDKDNHRIVFVGRNAKLLYSGEWVRRKAVARMTLDRLILYVRKASWHELINGIQERPYKPGAFAKNAGPKRKPAKK